MEAIKRCATCGADKPLSEYALHSTGALGRHSACKACGRAYSRQWAKTRPPQTRRRKRCPLAVRAQKYRLSHQQVRQMLSQQACEACGTSLSCDSDKRIDHNHGTGAVRGVLCDRCNRVAGMCEEKQHVLMGICHYLSRTANVDYRKQPYVEQEMRYLDSSSAGQLTPEDPARTCPTNTTPQPISPHP